MFRSRGEARDKSVSQREVFKTIPHVNKPVSFKRFFRFCVTFCQVCHTCMDTIQSGPIKITVCIISGRETFLPRVYQACSSMREFAIYEWSLTKVINSWGNIYSDFYVHGIRNFLICYQKFSDVIRNFLMNQKFSDSILYRQLTVGKEFMQRVFWFHFWWLFCFQIHIKI